MKLREELKNIQLDPEDILIKNSYWNKTAIVKVDDLVTGEIHI